MLSCSSSESQLNYLIQIAGSSGHPLDTNYIDGTNAPFNLSYSKWTKKSITYFVEYPIVNIDPVTRKVLKYSISDYFTNSDKEYIESNITKGIKSWSPHTGVTINRTNNKNNADFIITWAFIDGQGKKFAEGDFPPVPGQTNKPRIVFDYSDMYGAVKNRDRAQYPIYNIILHELGHTIAGLNHYSSFSIMNSAFNYNSLQIDDVLGARFNYKIYSDFSYNNREFTFIESIGNFYKTKNFKTSEFLSSCPYRHEDGHFISLNTIKGLQYLRNTYGVPIKILSTFRTPECNSQVGGAKESQHLFRTAIDWKFIGKNAVNTQKKYIADINNKTIVLQSLLMLKIRGFGTYPYGYGTNHIDARNGTLWNNYYNNIGYMTWGEFKYRNSWYNVKNEYKKND